VPGGWRSIVAFRRVLRGAPARARVTWRLNSENAFLCRLHGQPSIAGAAGHVGSWAFYPQLYTGCVPAQPRDVATCWDKMHESSLHLQAFPRIASCAWRLTVESKERECWIFCWMAVELREWFAVTRSTFYSWSGWTCRFLGFLSSTYTSWCGTTDSWC
jgi:hypothetical protein